MSFESLPENFRTTYQTKTPEEKQISWNELFGKT